MEREMIGDKQRIIQDNIVLASTILYQPSQNIPDLAIVAGLALKEAGISREWVDITSIAIHPAIPQAFVKTFKEQYQNVFICDNLIYSLASIQRILLAADCNCCFGLTIVVEATPSKDTVTIGAMVWKKPNYIDLTTWLPEGIISLILNSDSPDIVQTTIDNVNKELNQRQEPRLYHKDIKIVEATDNPAESMGRFFQITLCKDQLVMLVLPHAHGKTHSSVLIQT